MKYIITSCISLLVGAGLVYAYHLQVLASMAESTEAAYQDGFTAGVEAIRENIDESSYAAATPATEETGRWFQGTVVSVANGMIAASVLSNDPFDLDFNADRTISLTANTVIYQVSEKDEETLQAEIAAAELAAASAEDETDFVAVNLPSPFVNTEIPLRAVEAGDHIRVLVTADSATAAVLVAKELYVDETALTVDGQHSHSHDGEHHTHSHGDEHGTHSH